MTPAMLKTARALAAAWDGPPLVQHVVSKGGAVEEYACPECGEEMLEDVGVCPECGCDGWISTVTYPNPDTVPALSDSHGGLANVGPLSARLPVHWRLEHVEDGWGVSKDPRHRRGSEEEIAFIADSPAEALARAQVAGWTR